MQNLPKTEFNTNPLSFIDFKNEPRVNSGFFQTLTVAVSDAEDQNKDDRGNRETFHGPSEKEIK